MDSFTSLRSVQNDESESVIPSASKESIMDSSLRFAPFRMTKAKVSFRAQARNPLWILHSASLRSE
jgi:hypothetical protein